VSVAIAYMLAEIKIRPLYTCSKCGTQLGGGTARMEVNAYTTEELAAKVRNAHISNAHMPVGWASFHRPDGDAHVCPICKDKP